MLGMNAALSGSQSWTLSRWTLVGISFQRLTGGLGGIPAPGSTNKTSQVCRRSVVSSASLARI